MMDELHIVEHWEKIRHVLETLEIDYEIIKDDVGFFCITLTGGPLQKSQYTFSSVVELSGFIRGFAIEKHKDSI